MTTKYNLLSEPLITWRDARGDRHRATLPEVLAQLGAGAVTDFPALRAHQFDPWACFLTQLAAIALHRNGKSEPKNSASEWMSMLLSLTDESHEPWSLVVSDLSKPGFLQPPIPEGSIDRWKVRYHPDDIDVLVTSKKHDVKTSLVSGSNIEAWIVAGVTLQTMQGYPGRGYNRIARMKGGYGSRPRVGLAPDLKLGSRFDRDTRVLLDTWDELLKMGFSEDGVALTWLPPWDGTKGLSVTDLAPHFVEICWRIRFEEGDSGLQVSYTTTEERRCAPEVENGDVGDPWIPVEAENGALTIGRRGFNYQLMAHVILGDDYRQSATQRIRTDDPDSLVLLASAMARGQGKTDGLHNRTIVVPGKIRRSLVQSASRAKLATRALDNVIQAKEMRSRVLFPALRCIALDDEVPKDDFDARVDELFFDVLFSSIEQSDEDAKLVWDRSLYDVAWSELQGAIDQCTVPIARWYEAVSAAEGVFMACLTKHFPTFAAHLRQQFKD